MRKLRFIECSDGTRAHVGDTVRVTYKTYEGNFFRVLPGSRTCTGVIDDIHSDARFELRTEDALYQFLATAHCITIELIERKKK